MVLRKGKCLHEKSPTPCRQELEYSREYRQIVIQEVDRWQTILSVNYANYILEKEHTI